jgi:hypothetical protein
LFALSLYSLLVFFTLTLKLLVLVGFWRTKPLNVEWDGDVSHRSSLRDGHHSHGLNPFWGSILAASLGLGQMRRVESLQIGPQPC